MRFFISGKKTCYKSILLIKNKQIKVVVRETVYVSFLRGLFYLEKFLNSKTISDEMKDRENINIYTITNNP